MTEPTEEAKSEEKVPLNDSTRVDIDPDESSAHLIKNGGAGGAGDLQDDYKTTVVGVGVKTPPSSDGEVSFNGLGKDEVLKYANDPFWVRLRWILFILFWVGWIAMLVTAITIIVLAPRCPPRPDLKWYNTEVVYKIFPQSFKDSDADGNGDFKGMLEKLSYVTDKLGVKAIWLSSIYPHDNKDGDYGVEDHKMIDPKLGVSLADFTDWIKKMRKEGKKVILDLIPNQSSKNHEWFQKFLKDEAPYKDYYIRANKTGGPSSLWMNQYKGKAWTEEYFHQFSESHPDLNLRNEDVVNEIKEIMKFWFDAGVSGFYIRDLEYLIEDFDDKNGQVNSQDTFQFLEALREVADQYSDKPGRERALFGLVTQADKNQTLEYGGTGDKKRLHIVVPNLKTLDVNCSAKCVKKLAQNILVKDNNHWLGLQLTTENIGRVASRLESTTDSDYKKRLMFAHAIQLLLPGTPINYYGDEFGQRNGPYNDSLDLHGREITMGPMQWNTEKCAGFTTGDAFCNMSDNKYLKDNVEAGFAHFANLTPLESFIKLLGLRKNESFQWGVTEVFNPQDDLLLFTRKAFRFPHFMVLINMGRNTIHVSPGEVKLAGVKDVGIVRYHNREIDVNKEINVAEFAQHLEPYDIVVIEFPADD